MRRSALVVAPAVVLTFGADDAEVLVELDVDLAAVVECDLDLVVALLVADLGAGDASLAGVRERGSLRLLEGAAGGQDATGPDDGSLLIARRFPPEPTNCAD